MVDVARCYNRFHVRCTPNNKRRLRTFGEVLARRPAPICRKVKHGPLTGYGLGQTLSYEHIIHSKAGVFQSRSVRRLPPDWCWSEDAVDSMTWTSWKTASIMQGSHPRESPKREPIVDALLPTISEAFKYAPNVTAAASNAATAAASPRESTTTTPAPQAAPADEAIHPQDIRLPSTSSASSASSSS